MDSLQHLSYTGVNNDGILTNLEKLTHTNSKIIIRIPLIPDYNDNEQNLQEIALLANRLSISEIHLMPFHQFGKEKYMRFGFDYALSNLTGIQGTQEGKKHLQQALNIFANAGINAQIGG
jgi:pyruvate formate lyase activating enzyme